MTAARQRERGGGRPGRRAGGRSGRGPLWWMGQVRGVVVVAVMTAVTWLIAEGQTVTEVPLEVPVRLELPESMVWRVSPEEAESWLGRVSARVVGASASLSRLRERIGRDGAVRLSINDLPARAGLSSVDLREELRESPLFRDAGVTVAGVEPARLTLEHDRRVSVSMRVLPDVPAERLAGAAEVSPGVVEVELPAEFAGRLGADPMATVTLAEGELDRLPRGVVQSVPVQPKLPGELDGVWGERVPRVELKLEVANTTARVQLPVEVGVLLGSEDAVSWLVELQQGDMARLVTLSGPRPVIDRFRTGELVVTAVVRLTRDELEARATSKRIELIGLPAGVTGTVEPPEARLRVRSQNQPRVGPPRPE